MFVIFISVHFSWLETGRHSLFFFFSFFFKFHILVKEKTLIKNHWLKATDQLIKSHWSKVIVSNWFSRVKNVKKRYREPKCNHEWTIHRHWQHLSTQGTGRRQTKHRILKRWATRIKHRGWTYALVSGKQSLFLIRHPTCYSHIYK